MARNKVVNGYEFVTYSVNRHFQLFYSEKNHKTYPMHYHNAMEITMPMTRPYGCTGEQISCTADAEEILFIGSGILHSVGPLKGQEGGGPITPFWQTQTGSISSRPFSFFWKRLLLSL